MRDSLWKLHQGSRSYIADIIPNFHFSLTLHYIDDLFPQRMGMAGFSLSSRIYRDNAYRSMFSPLQFLVSSSRRPAFLREKYCQNRFHEQPVFYSYEISPSSCAGHPAPDTNFFSGPGGAYTHRISRVSLPITLIICRSFGFNMTTVSGF